jgi:hypothetical protein
MRKDQIILRGRLGRAVRDGRPDADQLRAELKASRAVDYIEDLLTDPSPTVEDRCRLADLLITDPS